MIPISPDIALCALISIAQPQVESSFYGSVETAKVSSDSSIASARYQVLCLIARDPRPGWPTALALKASQPKKAMKNLSRIVAWLLLFTIVVLSVVPPADRPVTSAPHDIEHLAIFLLTGVAFGFGYANFWSQLCGLILFSAAIELVQLVIPGRHARPSDFIVDALSAGIGVTLAFAYARYIAARKELK